MARQSKINVLRSTLNVWLKIQSERGAILVQVAVVLLGLTLFSAFVVDYGIMWTSRSQVQVSADAAALAGAQALTFDNTTEANVKLIAQKVGLSNAVFAESPDIQTSDITIIDCPPTPGLPNDKCIQARAFRNQARNNPLPTIFAQLAGVGDQGVQAIAVARAVSGTQVTCLKPWAVGDKWFDTAVGGWQQSATFNPGAGDYYTPPNPGPPEDPGTGFSAKKANGDPDYYGYQMVLKLDNPGQGNGSNATPIDSAGWAMELCLDHTGDNNNCSTPAYKDNISDCTSEAVNISPFGSPVCTAEDPSIGCLHVKTGGTGGNNATAIKDFIDSHDPGATWSDGGGPTGWQTGVIHTNESPSSRIVPVAIFDVPEYLGTGCTGSNCYVRVLKFVGFFVEGTCQDSFAKESVP